DFVEAVFCIRPVAIVPGHGDGRVGLCVERGNQHGDLSAPWGGTGVPAFADSLGQAALPIFSTAGSAGFPDGSGSWIFAHEDHAPLFAPATKTKGGFQRLPTITAVLPDRSLAHHAHNKVFDFGRMAQL